MCGKTEDETPGRQQQLTQPTHSLCKYHKSKSWSCQVLQLTHTQHTLCLKPPWGSWGLSSAHKEGEKKSNTSSSSAFELHFLPFLSFHRTFPCDIGFSNTYESLDRTRTAATVEMVLPNLWWQVIWWFLKYLGLNHTGIPTLQPQLKSHLFVKAILNVILMRQLHTGYTNGYNSVAKWVRFLCLSNN